MKIKTGYTVYELVVSVDADNNPVSSTTFTNEVFIDGLATTGVTLNISLSDPINAIFSASFSGSTFGSHQFHMKNDITNVIYISDSYEVSSDLEVDTSPTIFVGL